MADSDVIEMVPSDHKTSMRPVQLPAPRLSAAVVWLLIVSPAAAFGAGVDEATLNGWRIYQEAHCQTCHEPDAEGAAAFPSLVDSLKTMTQEQFSEIVLNGRKNMPMFKNNKKVRDRMNDLYTFLKGRADGTVPTGDLELGQ